MAGNPILTVQLGGFSNFIGAHWWNLQEFSYVDEAAGTIDIEIDHEVLFCQKLSKNTYVHFPRLIAFDLKGSLGSHSFQDEHEFLCDPDLNRFYWEGGKEVHKSHEVSKPSTESHLPSRQETQHPFFEKDAELEQPNRVWADYLNTTLHPRSINLLRDFQHQNLVEPFDVFPLGVSVANQEDRREETEDQVRRFVEECDYLQGFQVLLDTHNGFSGLASRFIQHLREEYSNKSTVAFPVFPTAPEYDVGRMESLINTGLVVSSLFEDCSMFSPLSLDPSWASVRYRRFKHLDYKPFLPFHQAAILATALDTVTLPLRKKSDLRLNMSSFVNSLVLQGRKAVGISCVLPIHEKLLGMDSLEAISKEMVSLTPGTDRYEDVWTQSLSWRGTGGSGNIQTLVDQWSSSHWAQCITENTVFRSACPAQSPYPKFFADNLADTVVFAGDVGKGIASFPTYAGIHSSPSLGLSFEQLHSDISKVNLRKLHRFTSMGMDCDEFSENQNRWLLHKRIHDMDHGVTVLRNSKFEV